MDEQQIKWIYNFIDYVFKNYESIYDNAAEHADKLDKDD